MHLYLIVKTAAQPNITFDNDNYSEQAEAKVMPRSSVAEVEVEVGVEVGVDVKVEIGVEVGVEGEVEVGVELEATFTGVWVGGGDVFQHSCQIGL